MGIALPRDLNASLDAYCAEHDMTKSQFIRHCIREKLAREDAYTSSRDRLENPTRSAGAGAPAAAPGERGCPPEKIALQGRPRKAQCS